VLARRGETAFVDELVRSDADAPPAGVADLLGQTLAFFGGKHLAVAKVGPPGAGKAGIEDDGAGHDGPGQRPAARFIHTSDVSVALPPCRELRAQRGHRLVEPHRVDASTARRGM
jgi:hypothetical protein